MDVYVDKEVDADELEKNEGELERKLGEVSLTQSRATGLIKKWDWLVGLVYVVGLKIRYRQEIGSY